MIKIALPKGRLGDKVLAMFENAGYPCPEIHTPSRKLVFSTDKVSYFFVKPSDVPIYVERGVADIGVAGSDILVEYEPDVYSLLDLGIGKCRLCVAAKEDFEPFMDRLKAHGISYEYINENNQLFEILI